MPVMLHAPAPEKAANDTVRQPPVTESLNIGDALRLAREGHGRSLEACAAVLRMHMQDLRALEGNDFAALPGGGVTIAWLRRYARFLGLNPELLTAAYRAQHQTEIRSFRSDLTASIRRKSRRGKRRAFMALALTLGGVVMILVAGLYAVSAGGLSGLRAPETAEGHSSAAVPLMPVAPLAPARQEHDLPERPVPSSPDSKGSMGAPSYELPAQPAQSSGL